MVAKIVSCQSIRGILNYNENKVKAGDADLIMANCFGTDLDKLDFSAKLNRFEHLTSLNSRVKTNAIHVMLSFDKQDNLTVATLQKIAVEYMERLGFEYQPYLAYLHRDANHPHLHLVTTNLMENGKRIPIHNIGRNLSEPARKDIENQYNLVKAEGRRNSELIVNPIDIQKALYGKVPTKKAINNIVNAVLGSYKFTSFAEYNAALSVFGVNADRGRDNTIMYEKRGLIYSIIDTKGKAIGIPFKASTLSNRPVLENVEKAYESNRVSRVPFQPNLKKEIDSIFRKYEKVTQNTFINELHQAKVDLILRRSDQGYIYGATFIDHRNRTVFNGSALGKNYSAKALTEKFGAEDIPRTFLDKPALSPKYLKPASEEPRKTFLPQTGQTNYLESLLGKTTNDYGSSIPNRKKKRRRGRSL